MRIAFRHLLTLSAFFLGAASLHAQSISVTATQSYVQGLTYSGGKQNATWTFTATPSGIPPYWHLSYMGWEYDGQAGPGGNQIVPFTMTVHAPGVHEVSAVFVYGGVQLTGYRSVAAIGGPLNLGWLAGSSGNTPHHDDNLPTNPVYIQYFYPASHTMIAYDEVEQWGTVKAMLGQPTTTKVTYSPPGNVVAQQSVTNVDPATTIQLKPNGTGLGAITGSFSMNYVDPTTGQTLSGSAQDDTSSSGVPYQFDGHYPGTMFLVTGDPNIPVNPLPYWVPDGGSNAVPDPGGTWGGWLYLYGLLDSSGLRMPGVWVNEHFGSGTPPGLQTNPAGTGWETIWGTVAFDSTATWGAAYFGQHGGGPNGGAYDGIASAWVLPQPWTGWNFIHYYNGATLDVLATSGVPVGTYSATMQPGGPSNSPHANVNQQ